MQRKRVSFAKQQKQVAITNSLSHVRRVLKVTYLIRPLKNAIKQISQKTVKHHITTTKILLCVSFVNPLIQVGLSKSLNHASHAQEIYCIMQMNNYALKNLYVFSQYTISELVINVSFAIPPKQEVTLSPLSHAESV
jgi:hypothetical protein